MLGWAAARGEVQAHLIFHHSLVPTCICVTSITLWVFSLTFSVLDHRELQVLSEGKPLLLLFPSVLLGLLATGQSQQAAGGRKREKDS